VGGGERRAGDASLGVPPDPGYEGFSGRAEEKDGASTTSTTSAGTRCGDADGGRRGGRVLLRLRAPQNDLRARTGAAASARGTSRRSPCASSATKGSRSGRWSRPTRWSATRPGQLPLRLRETGRGLPRLPADGRAAELDLSGVSGRFTVAGSTRAGAARSGRVLCARSRAGRACRWARRPPSRARTGWRLRRRPPTSSSSSPTTSATGTWRLRAEAHPDAEPRPHGREGLRFTDFYAGSRLRPLAGRAHDGPAHGHVSVRGTRGARTSGSRRCGRASARSPTSSGTRATRRRSSASGASARSGRRPPEPHGLRDVLRLPQPAPRPQLLPVLPLRNETRVSLGNVPRRRTRTGAGWARTAWTTRTT